MFREAIEGIKAAKAAGFLVTSNTTIYKETDIEEIADLFEYLQKLGVDGHMLSPAYSYAAVMTKDIFMSREEIREKFQQASALLERYNIMISPVYHGFSARRTRADVHGVGKSDVSTRSAGKARAT